MKFKFWFLSLCFCMSWTDSKSQFAIISHISILNFIWLALTVPHVLLWCYQRNYYNLWRVHINSTNISAPTSLLQSINAHRMMNIEKLSPFKVNYCVFKWQLITHFSNWTGLLIKLLSFVMDTLKNNECILFFLWVQDTRQYKLPSASLL